MIRLTAAPSIARRSATAAACALGLYAATLVSAAQAQTYPAKAVRIVVPFPAGGSLDVVVRTLAPRLSEALVQPVVIDNRSGAGGATGTELVAKSPPDGYTLLAGTIGGLAVSPTLNPRLGYNTLRDLAPVTQLVNVSYIMTLHPSVPALDQGFAGVGKIASGQIELRLIGRGHRPASGG